MARTVRDAAILLGLLVGSDPLDVATLNCEEHRFKDYTQFLEIDGLKGASKNRSVATILAFTTM